MATHDELKNMANNNTTTTNRPGHLSDTNSNHIHHENPTTSNWDGRNNSRGANHGRRGRGRNPHHHHRYNHHHQQNQYEGRDNQAGQQQQRRNHQDWSRQPNRNFRRYGGPNSVARHAHQQNVNSPANVSSTNESSHVNNEVESNQDSNLENTEPTLVDVDYHHHESTITQSSDQPAHNRRRQARMRTNRQPQKEEAATSGDAAQSQIAQTELKTNTFECMICCDNVRRTQSIWYCNNCYNIFHLKCSIEWCNKSIASKNEALQTAQYPILSEPATRQQIGGGSNISNQRNSSVEWPCPACRELLHSRPGKYKCYCGKVIYPEVNRLLTPHSCGQLCGRKRPNSFCPHNCNSLCHPGRCDPCPLTCRRSCFCGKRVNEEKCSLGQSSCDQICGKTLSCGRHSCSKVCHDGPCQICDEYLSLNCNCGKQSISRSCDELAKESRQINNKEKSSKQQQSVDSNLAFSCDSICNRRLDCGNHFCKIKCHSGPCRSCMFLNDNITTCPCGTSKINKSQLIQRKSCLDPISTCGNKCNKQLICGPEKNHHRCHKKCHLGPCPPCKLKTIVHCECRGSTKNIDCGLMFEKLVVSDAIVEFKQTGFVFNCEYRCNKLKHCSRHRCNYKCCQYLNNPNLHKCDQICNKKLACGKHNCPEPCHLGQCGDCTNIGWEEMRCHCGASVLYPPIPCGAGRPTCNRPCRRTHTCGHPVKHECHDETEKCAPCTMFVEKSCFCGAESKDSVYCYLPGYSCGRTCKKELRCGQHQCTRVCHANECEPPLTTATKSCNQPCQVARFNCKHPCGLPCHGKSPCPPSECKKEVEITCKCGNKTDRISCFKVMKDVDNSNKMAMLRVNRASDGENSIMIDLSKKSTNTNNRPNNINDENFFKRLNCDDNCALYERNKALAEALDLEKPDLKPALVFGEDPLKLLKEAIIQDYKFVSTTFASLAKFVTQAKESDKRFLFMQYPPCDQLRREIIHELAHHFHCTSESRGEEPFKQVIVRAYKNKSLIPEFSIEQLVPITE